jgi:hypothetical protein
VASKLIGTRYLASFTGCRISCYILPSFYAPILPSTPFTNSDSGTNAPELFHHSLLDLRFDLAFLECRNPKVVSAIPQSLGSPTVQEDSEYDPEIDGTSDDERILPQNTLHPLLPLSPKSKRKSFLGVAKLNKPRQNSSAGPCPSSQSHP